MVLFEYDVLRAWRGTKLEKLSSEPRGRLRTNLV